ADVVYRLREADTEGPSRLQTLILRGGSRMPLWGIACLLLLLPVWRHNVPLQMDLPDDSALRSSFFALYLLFYVLRSFFAQQAQRVTPESQPAEGDARVYESQGSILWLRLFSLAVWVVIFLYGFDAERMAWFALPVPVGFRWVCIGWSGVNLGLLIWTHQSLGPNWSRRLQIPAEQTIVTHGPYQWVRHPMYTLLCGFYLSTAFAASNALILIVSLGMAWGLYVRVQQEEHMMLQHFGDDYRAYMQRTGRFLPRSRRR
ncbi:MAG: isoprenylcysteine carboxylmethyltransferase family protein, partial [Candidatus Tectomicrobia bacterium]|nr:isoprenylcysteine carboxylmethyltransferase family protein [Candidatus Tectomicrobia bacterium]